MMKPREDSAWIMLVVCGIAASGCGGRTPQQGPTDGRFGVADPIEITMTEAPDEWDTVLLGATLLAGVIDAEHGLNPANPKTLSLRVRDLQHGFTEDRAYVEGDAEAPHWSLDYSTGEFSLDLTEDFRICEGLQELTLTVQDTLGNEESWVRHVRVTPVHDNWSWAQLASSRQLYGIQLVRLYGQYRAFMEAVVQRGVDPTVFPELGYDFRVLRLHENLILNTFIADPHMAEWRSLADASLAEAEGLRSIGAPLSPAETLYREELESVALGLTTLFVTPASVRRTWQLAAIEGGGSPATSAPDRFLWEEAFFRHVFSEATVTEDGEGNLVYRGALYADDGVLAITECCEELPPFVEPESDTWQANAPVFELIATASDTNADGLIDSLVLDGVSNGKSLVDVTLTPEQQTEYAEDLTFGLPHLGHLIGPLDTFTRTPYFQTD